MTAFYGAKTGMVDSDNKNLYEYDRVYVMYEGEKYSGTILNMNEQYHPQYKVLIDKFYWKFDTNPMIVELVNGNSTLIKKGEENYHYGRSVYLFQQYCYKYDYHKSI